MLKCQERRLIASVPLQLGGGDAYSELTEKYDGPTKMLYDIGMAVFPSQSEAVLAACMAVRPDIGGYSKVVLVAPDSGDRVTHETSIDWLCGGVSSVAT